MMNKFFHVYENNTKDENKKQYIFIKKGFNFYAFLFYPIWFAHKKFWSLFLVSLFIYLSINIMFYYNLIDSVERNIISFGLMFFFGASSSEIQEYFLLKYGYKKKYTIIENNLLNAKKKFYDSTSKTTN